MQNQEEETGGALEKLSLMCNNCVKHVISKPIVAPPDAAKNFAI